MHIMLVDDEDDRIAPIRRAIHELAGEYGEAIDFTELYQIVPSVTTGGGPSARFEEADFIDAVRKLPGPPSVAVVDYWLKWPCRDGSGRTMTGLDVGRFLREHWGQHPPFYILFTSAYISRDGAGSVGDLADLLKTPFSGFLLEEGDWHESLKAHLEWSIPAVAAARRACARRGIRELIASPLRRALGDGFRSGSRAMAQLESKLGRYVDASRPLMLLGESGVGKSTIAKAVHESSGRKGAFYTVEMSSVPAGTFESELFGHIKGAFTGATDTKAGKVAMADGGTLFLDEVADIPLEHQGKLLRLLREGEYTAVGSTEVKTVDVRVVAATCRPVRDMVRDGTFREDLWSRLNAVVVDVPPLRDRGHDVVELAMHFLRATSPEVPWALTTEAEAWLLRQRWQPGNITDLDNLMFRVQAEALDHVVTDKLLGGLSDQRPITGTDAPYFCDRTDYEQVARELEARYWAFRLLGFTTLTEAAKAAGFEDHSGLSQRLGRLGHSKWKDLVARCEQFRAEFEKWR